MRVRNAVLTVLIAAVALHVQLGNAVNIGSDTAVARFNTQQILDDGDRIAGFAAIEEGFALKGSFVSGTFDCLFPVTGRIDLNGGTLILDKKIYLDHISDLAVLGNITGKDRLLELSSSVTAISSLSDDVFHCKVFSIVEEVLSEATRSVDWSWDSQYLAVGTEVVSTTSGLIIYDFDGSTLSQVLTSSIADTETMVTEVRWHPSQYVLALVRQSSAGGDEVFTFSFVPSTKQLIQLSSDEIGDSVRAAAWHPTGSHLAVGGVSNTAEIVIYPVDAQGALDTASKLNVNVSPNSRNVSNESLDWDNTGNYLGVGYNTVASNPELEIYAFNSSPLSLTLNASKVIGNKVDGLDWNPTFSWILAVGLDGSGDNIAVYAHDNIAGSLTKLTGDDLGGDGQAVDWHPDGDCVAIGRNKVASISKFRTYEFDKDVPGLVLATDTDFAQNIGAVRWSPNGKYVAEGHGINLSVYGLIRNHCSTFNNVNLMTAGPLTLRNCCIHFSGNCSINGGGHELKLDSSCVLQIEDNSQLHLINMTLRGVTSTRLTMAGSGSSLLFEDVNMKIGNKFAIKKGYFDVSGILQISGSGNHFIYSTDQVSTIRERSALLLDEDLTFSYDAEAPNLLAFADKTSELILAGATLHATSTGLVLTTGKLKVVENSAFSSEVIQQDTIIDNGITVGSGMQADDMKVLIMPNLELACTQGSIKYKNVGANALKMRNNFSHFHFYPGTTLRLFENMDVRPGFIEFDDQATLLTARGKNLTGSIVPNGFLSRRQFTP